MNRGKYENTRLDFRNTHFHRYGSAFYITANSSRLISKKKGQKMDLQTAKNLRPGDYVHHVEKKNADGSPMRAKVTSVKTWKRNPDRVLIGLKHGLYDYVKFTENDIHFIEKGR